MRYCSGLGWLAWDGTHWRWDDTGKVKRRIKKVVRSLYAIAADIDDETDRKLLLTFARECERQAKITAVAALAESELPIPIRADELDADPWLLNAPNGTVDLHTGELRPHRREDLLTKLTGVPFDPAAEAVRLLKFLNEIFDKGEELIAFVQRSLGAALVGLVREHVLHVLHGVGANGKSTLLETIKAVLRDYAMIAAPRLLMLKRHDAHPTELAELRAMRLIAAIESGEGRRLDEERVKQLTGGDTIKGRYLYRDFFEFTPSHTVLLGTNHKPEILGTDLAIWRRIRLWPFNVLIPPERQDKALKEKLLEEGPAILGWLVQGCLDWQERGGLGEPEAVRVATESYRGEQDTVQRFLNECCVLDPDRRTAAGNFHERFVKWSGERISMRRLNDLMREAGYELSGRSTGGRRFWEGIGLPESDPSDPNEAAEGN